MKLAKSLSDKLLFIINNDIHDDVSILAARNSRYTQFLDAK